MKVLIVILAVLYPLAVSSACLKIGTINEKPFVFIKGSEPSSFPVAIQKVMYMDIV